MRECGDRLQRNVRQRISNPEQTVQCIKRGNQFLHTAAGSRIHEDHGNPQSIGQLQGVYRLSGSDQQVGHRQCNDGWLALPPDQAAKLQVTLKLRRVNYENESIWLDLGMPALDDFYRQFFLRRRRHTAMNTRQVDNVSGSSELGLTSSTEERNGDACVIRSLEVSAGEGIHEGGLARVGHSHKTYNVIFGSGGSVLCGLGAHSTQIHAASRLPKASRAPRTRTIRGSPSGTRCIMVISSPGVKPRSRRRAQSCRGPSSRSIRTALFRGIELSSWAEETITVSCWR